jgi:hypothetical protein
MWGIFITFIVLGFSSDPQRWLRNIKFELRERFEGESGVRDRTVAENSTIIRWMLLILGASQFQTIKLMAMEGILWTQAWAMMFTISIVFGEVLILLVRSLSLQGGSADTVPLWCSYLVVQFQDIGRVGSRWNHPRFTTIRPLI